MSVRFSNSVIGFQSLRHAVLWPKDVVFTGPDRRIIPDRTETSFQVCHFGCAYCKPISNGCGVALLGTVTEQSLKEGAVEFSDIPIGDCGVLGGSRECRCPTGDCQFNSRR